MLDVPMLKIENLVKKYGEKIAVNDVSLTIPKGSFFGLLGQNGAGKSSIIHCITGVGKITSGRVLLDGIDVDHDYKDARAKVGLSPQEFNVDIFSTAPQLLDYVGGYYGMRKAERGTRVEELLTQFDLQAHRTKKFMELSGGLKRRVVLARALIHQPPLLILDEPTAGVDVEQRHQLWEYLKKQNENGTTIILTSHYLEEIGELCNDIAVLHNGKIVVHETKEEFTKNGSVEKKYLEITKSEQQ
jgi:ABC-2 type transport system ATP-binding protein